ncbi:MAG: trypsin-like serine protease [Planctomycetota bacterium]
MKRIWSAASLLAGLVATTSLAGTIRHDRSEQLYLNLANQPEFDSVGRFNWNEPGGSFLASGVLVSPDWVLTAAHVVDGTDNLGAGISNLRFQLGGDTIGAAEWIPHVNWGLSGGETNLFAGWDIGLVRLSERVTDVAPATLYLDRDELAQTATLVGFGTTGTGLTGATQPGGTKRAGRNVIDAVGTTTTPGSVISPPTDRIVTVDFDEPGVPGTSTLGSPTPLDLEYLTAPGDSGGGLFLEQDGDLLLAGITSLGSTFSGQADSDYGDRASFTRVSSFINWIEGTAGLDLTDPLPGDYDRNGEVDIDDYTLWQAQFGLTAAGDGLPADGNGDGVVDAADFTLWRDNLDTQSGNLIDVAGVPEPTAAGLFASLPIACLAGRRRRGGGSPDRL